MVINSEKLNKKNETTIYEITETYMHSPAFLGMFNRVQKGNNKDAY